MTKVDKPWGHELIWARTDQYVGKILFVAAGESLSLQYHVKKDETIMVLSGQIELTHYLDNERPETELLGPNVPFHITPGMRHRMKALVDSHIVEVSTPELDDVVRLEDRYGRVR